MSETGKDQQEQKPKTCGLAKWTFVLGLGSLMSPFFLYPIVGRAIPLSVSLFGLVVLIIGGGASLSKILRSKGQLKGLSYAICAMVIALVITSLVILRPPRKRSTAYRMVCGSNLSKLGKALLLYAQDNDQQYPTPDKWCDLLLKGGYATSEKIFKCPDSKEGRCSYTINPNAKPLLSPDVVLLFESKGGWNQYGGADLLAPENHKGEGCNILFNDTRVNFERTKGLCELKWKSEDSNSVGKSISK